MADAHEMFYGSVASRIERRVGVVVLGIPHPSEGASSVLFFHYIKALVDSGCKLLVQIVSECRRGDPEKMRAFVTAIAGGDAAVEVIEVAATTKVLTPNRFSVKQNLELSEIICNNLSFFDATNVVAFDLPAAMLVRNYSSGKKLAWIGDLRFQSEWFHFLYSVRESFLNARHFVYALPLRFRWRKLYKETLRKYETVLVASKSSEVALAELGIEAEFAAYPWPNEGEVDKSVKRSLPEKPTFIFFGHLYGLGSRSALHFMFKKLYPVLVNIWGHDGFEIKIGGREEPPSWIVDELSGKPEVQLVGFIEDLTEALSKVHAVIAPLDVPVGNRSRIITAQAKRTLVVCHKNAALGNPFLVHDETCLLAENPQDFATAMVTAFEDVKLSSRVIDQAERSYLETYHPERATCRLIAGII